ncbi:MAG TPA: hypothetical protein VGR84_10050 [Candidatus Acidoferrales bacterium]|nr:hypothetical protein [Candidatus Acidoferrales bacterium]
MIPLPCSTSSLATTRVALVLCSVFVLAVNSPVAGQNAPVDPRGQTQTTPNPCGGTDKARIYGPVKASYIGGTVVGMPLKRKGDFPVYWFGARQLRVEGKLVMDQTEAQFCFQKPAGAKVLPGPSYTTTCTDQQNAGQCLVEFPYAQINGLSRASKLSENQATNRTVYVTAATAILSAILSTSSKTHTKEMLGGITVFAGVLGYFFVVARPERMENYIAVFVRPCASSVHRCSGTAGTSDSVFPRGDLVMFRVPNHHDYYNISMILSAETGRTFVPETAEAGAKSSSKQ